MEIYTETFEKVSSDSIGWATQSSVSDKLTVNMLFSGQLLGTPESGSNNENKLLISNTQRKTLNKVNS